MKQPDVGWWADWKLHIRETQHSAYPVLRQVSPKARLLSTLLNHSTDQQPKNSHFSQSVFVIDTNLSSLVVTVNPVAAPSCSAAQCPPEPRAVRGAQAWWVCWAEVVIRRRIFMRHCPGGASLYTVIVAQLLPTFLFCRLADRIHCELWTHKAICSCSSVYRGESRNFVQLSDDSQDLN